MTRLSGQRLRLAVRSSAVSSRYSGDRIRTRGSDERVTSTCRGGRRNCPTPHSLDSPSKHDWAFPLPGTSRVRIADETYRRSHGSVRASCSRRSNAMKIRAASGCFPGSHYLNMTLLAEKKKEAHTASTDYRLTQFAHLDAHNYRSRLSTAIDRDRRGRVLLFFPERSGGLSIPARQRGRLTRRFASAARGARRVLRAVQDGAVPPLPRLADCEIRCLINRSPRTSRPPASPGSCSVRFSSDGRAMGGTLTCCFCRLAQR